MNAKGTPSSAIVVPTQHARHLDDSINVHDQYLENYTNAHDEQKITTLNPHDQPAENGSMDHQLASKWTKDQTEDASLGRVIGNRYKLISKIGAGAFGIIYRGSDLIISENYVAIKIEPKGIKVRQLAYEAMVYRELNGIHTMPRMHLFVEEETDSSLVMDLLGPSLEELFNQMDRIFPLSLVLQIADQMIQRIETLHSRHFLHRDIKPDNFVIGRDEKIFPGSPTVFLIDFGLAKSFRRTGIMAVGDGLGSTSTHIPFRDGKHLTGTARYASLNAHRGYEQSRRDDLESLGYVLIYFLKGSLPWQGLGRPKKPPPGTRPADILNSKYARIAECKKSTTIAELTQGLPPEFAAYFTHVRGLRFEERPDYDYLRKLLRAVARRESITTVMGKNVPSGLRLLGEPSNRQVPICEQELDHQGDIRGQAMDHIQNIEVNHTQSVEHSHNLTHKQKLDYVSTANYRKTTLPVGEIRNWDEARTRHAVSGSSIQIPSRLLDSFNSNRTLDPHSLISSRLSNGSLIINERNSQPQPHTISQSHPPSTAHTLDESPSLTPSIKEYVPGEDLYDSQRSSYRPQLGLAHPVRLSSSTPRVILMPSKTETQALKK